MKRTAVATRLRELVEPVAQKLADDLTELLVEHATKCLDSASGTAVESLRAQLEAKHVEDDQPDDSGQTRPAIPRRKKVGRRRRSPRPLDRARAEESAPTQTPTMKCHTCGEPGKNARGCGKTHNVAVEAKPAPSAVMPPPKRADRFAQIEAQAKARQGIQR